MWWWIGKLRQQVEPSSARALTDRPNFLGIGHANSIVPKNKHAQFPRNRAFNITSTGHAQFLRDLTYKFTFFGIRTSPISQQPGFTITFFQSHHHFAPYLLSYAAGVTKKQIHADRALLHWEKRHLQQQGLFWSVCSWRKCGVRMWNRRWVRW